jgi:hypothetical protein
MTGLEPATMSDMDEARRVPGWVLPAIGVATVVLLVVIGLNREPEQFDPDTAAGTVQSYIAALTAGDFETAAPTGPMTAASRNRISRQEGFPTSRRPWSGSMATTTKPRS